jgi:hypothetical protein
LPGHVVEQVMLRNDVEDRRASDAAGMIEAHAVKHARAAIVAGRVETLKAERLHHLHLILRHRPERIAAVVGAARRLLGIAITTQIGGDDGEVLRQTRRDLVPGHVRERVAVHQQ